LLGIVADIGKGRNTVADDLALFLDDVEQRGPFHEIGEVEVEVIVLSQGIEVREVHAEEVVGLGAADG
jgi:hypothetical protein